MTRQAEPYELESVLEAHFRVMVKKILKGHLIKMAPTEKGVPDRLVLLPGGRIYLVELKTTRGRLSPSQRVWHDRYAARLGGRVIVLSGRREIDSWVTSMYQLIFPEG